MDKIICVGKNYLDHAQELGDKIPEKPVLFFKPPSVLVSFNSGEVVEVSHPKNRGPAHHECEIVLRVAKDCYCVSESEAEKLISHVTLGLDMTLRDVQAQQKKNGHPWEIAKVFANSAVVGPWVKVQDFPHYLEEEFSFTLDGVLRQKSAGKNMRLSPAQCLSYASEFFQLCEGDLIFTGTPSGVGPVASGQTGELKWGSKLKYRVHWGTSRR